MPTVLNAVTSGQDDASPSLLKRPPAEAGARPEPPEVWTSLERLRLRVHLHLCLSNPVPSSRFRSPSRLLYPLLSTSSVARHCPFNLKHILVVQTDVAVSSVGPVSWLAVVSIIP